MTRTRVAAAFAVLALAGCGGTAATTSTAPASQSAPSAPIAAATTANPVTIVRQAGATPAPGAVHGNTWLSGLEALGSFSTPYHGTADYESVTVYTLSPAAGQTGEQAAAAVGAASSDNQVIIVGPDFYMYVDPASSLDPGSQPAWPVSPQVIAARVHGTVLAP